MKNRLKFPPTLNKKRRKKFERQRAKRGFSDYDCWDLDWYLMELIPSSIEHLADMSDIHAEHMWLFDTGERKIGMTDREFKDELLRAAAEFRRAGKLSRNAILKPDVDKAEESRLRCFEWLAHNIGTLWD